MPGVTNFSLPAVFRLEESSGTYDEQPSKAILGSLKGILQLPKASANDYHNFWYSFFPGSFRIFLKFNTYGQEKDIFSVNIFY